MTRSLLLFVLAIGCSSRQEDSDASTLDSGAPAREPLPCSTPWYPDRDGDGFGAERPPLLGCLGPPGWVERSGDCDDDDPERHPEASERCDGLDDDCDGQVDEDFVEPQQAWYPDLDGDGWGDPLGEQLRCGGGEGLVRQVGDCDDDDPRLHPASREPCDGLDNDCDGLVDEGCAGRCRDGVKGGPFEACDGADDHACPGACSAHCACPSAAPGPLRVHMVDVGQGDAFLVISPDGFVMLVDAGPSSACDDLSWYLDSQGVDAIDYTLLSHQHSDHHGSMTAMLEEHPEVVASFDNGGSFSDGSDWSYRRAVGRRRVPLSEGDGIDMGPQLSVEVLHADVGSGNENDNSLVIRLSHGAFDMLLGGDCELGCESSLELGATEVYKAHHHGSYNGSGPGLLARLQPLAALISVGEGNAYGHPHSSTLRALDEAGVDIFRSDRDGSVLISSDGAAFEIAGILYETHPDME
jgi:competence protein ComEC